MSYGAETQTLTSWHPIKGQANVEEYLNMEKQLVNNRKRFQVDCANYRYRIGNLSIIHRKLYINLGYLKKTPTH